MAAIAVVDMSPDAILVLELILHSVRSAGQIHLAFPVVMETNFWLTVLGYVGLTVGCLWVACGPYQDALSGISGILFSVGRAPDYRASRVRIPTAPTLRVLK